MSQEKAKIHLVQNPTPGVSEPDFYNAPEIGDEPEVCPACYGSGMEVVPGKGARPCKCRKKKTHTNLLDKARLPKRHYECHFHNYRAMNPTQERAIKFATKLAMDFPAVERGLLFMGTV